jgi:hypothetical protein
MKRTIGLIFLMLAVSLIAQQSISVIDLTKIGDRSWRKPVASISALPSTHNTLGDTIRVNDTGFVYHWNGSGWVLDGGGAIGATGLTGLQGLQGVKGDKGDKGDPGVDGLAGSGGGSSTTPAGTGSELQYRIDASTLGAVINSSVSGSPATVTFPGAINIGGTSSDYCKLDPIGFSLLRVKTANGSGYCILDAQSFRAFTPGGDMGVRIGGNTGVELSANATVTFSDQTDASQGSKIAGTYIDHTWITCGVVGSCSTGNKGTQRCAADGTLCWCNGSIWTATAPTSGSCV